MIREIQSETATLDRVLMKHPRDAFRDQATVDAQWETLNYLGRPDFMEACREADGLARTLADKGIEIDWLPTDDSVGIDSIYVRDNAIVTPRGIVLCNMGKAERAPEPKAMARWFLENGLPILGEIEGDGRIEGGDLVWLDGDVIAVGEGYRTNAEGIRQLKSLVEDTAADVLTVPMPHWNGPGDVLHLMSFISPIGAKKALVWSRIMAVTFRTWLLDEGWELIEVPDDEYDAMGCNVLALAPDLCLMLDGLPGTREQLERAGCEVLTYKGDEISRKGCGGPTCLTRPLIRIFS